MSHEISALIPFAIDLPAVGTNEAENQLQGILTSSPLAFSGVRLRNRFLGYADAWTVMRMEEHVRQSTVETACR